MEKGALAPLPYAVASCRTQPPVGWRAGLLALILPLLVVSPAGAEEGQLLPTRFGAGVGYGLTYDPTNDIDFALVSAVALFDYDRVWPHRAPQALRFKVEGSAGLAMAPGTRAMASANMLALYFLEPWATSSCRPYVEAGIGLVYTDFRVEGQGLRINFNPQAGLGLEIEGDDGSTWFAALRGHHVSNAELHRENRGINSVFLQLGRYF